MTSNALRKQLFRLSAAERLELVEELWDSIPSEDEALELTPEQRQDLDRRIAEAAKPDRRLQRRMQHIGKMNPRERRQVLQLIDAFIEREQLRSAKG